MSKTEILANRLQAIMKMTIDIFNKNNLKFERANVDDYGFQIVKDGIFYWINPFGRDAGDVIQVLSKFGYQIIGHDKMPLYAFLNVGKQL